MEKYHTLVRIPLAKASKTPLVHGWSTLPADSPIWAATFTAHPGCNVGIRLDDLLVIDCDSPEAVTWWQGEGTATRWQTTGNPERRTFWYGRQPGRTLGETGTFRLRPNVEVRFGHRFQQVVPPSIHPSGTPYRWVGNGGELTTAEIVPAPETVLDAERPSARSYGAESGGWDVVEAGGRDDFLTSVAGLLRAKGMSEAGMEAALMAVNQTVCQPPKSAADIKRIAHSVSRYDTGITYEIEGMG